MDYPVPGAWDWVLGAGEKGQDSSPGGTLLQARLQFQFYRQ